MTDLFKNVFWYIIREMYHEKFLPGRCAFFIPNQFKTQRVCDEARHESRNMPCMLGYVPDKYKTQGMCIKAVEKGLLQLQHVPDCLKTQGMCIMAAEENPCMMRHVPDRFKTQEMCNEEVRNKPCTLEYVTDKLKTQEICEKAFEKASWVLEDVPDHFKTQKMCEKAFRGGFFHYAVSGLRRDFSCLFKTVFSWYKTWFLCIENYIFRKYILRRIVISLSFY